MNISKKPKLVVMYTKQPESCEWRLLIEYEYSGKLVDESGHLDKHGSY